MDKLPIGLTPRYIVTEDRLTEVRDAIFRYINAGLCLPPEWIEEYNELVERVKNNSNG